jgi:hypothetical protein
MALSKGLELVQREDFEREVRRAVVATRDEYFQVMEAGTCHIISKPASASCKNLSGRIAMRSLRLVAKCCK